MAGLDVHFYDEFVKSRSLTFYEFIIEVFRLLIILSVNLALQKHNTGEPQ